ncbi:hypothetical protein GCM10027049_02020 [Mucilaginibacter puniceus]
MKNFKKIAFGLMVGALAIGFSAFTTANNSSVKYNKDANGKIVSVSASYYNISGDPTSTDPDNFIFRDGTTAAGCSSVTGKECKATWTTSNTPHNNQSPTDAGSPSLSSRGLVNQQYNGQ